MAKNIKLRIDESFDKVDPEKLVKFMEWSRESCGDYVQNIRRSSAILLLLIAAFELVANSRNSTLTIAEFKITRGSVVLVTIPAIVSYLFAQIALDTQRAAQANAAFAAAFSMWSAKAGENELEQLLYRPQPLYWTAITRDPKGDNLYRLDRMHDLSSVIFAIILIVAIVAFEVHAYFATFSSHHYIYILWGASLCISIFCLIFASFFAFGEVGEV
jgi:hypothetical protein